MFDNHWLPFSYHSRECQYCHWMIVDNRYPDVVSANGGLAGQVFYWHGECWQKMHEKSPFATEVSTNPANIERIQE